jgi:lipopolysaccharide heptosyltransferase II
MQNLLIVKLSSLGDVIHSLPAVQALRRRFPEARITWAVERAHAGVLRGTDLVDELIEWNRGTYAEFFAFIRKLRAQKWDLAIDMQGWQRSGFVTWLSGAKRRMGFSPAGEWSHMYYNEKVPAPRITELHAVERWLKLVEPLGAKFEGLPLRRGYMSQGDDLVQLDHPGRARAPAAHEMFPLPIAAADHAAVDRWLADHYVVAGRDSLVVLNPHCRKEANMWPAECYAALAEKLIAAGRKVVLTGGPVAKPLCDEISARTEGRVLRSDGQLSLLGSAELIRRSDLFVTGDTGPMHIAAAVGTPIIALFGPALPLKTGPYAADAIVINKHLPCAPCFARKCPLGHDVPKCMTDITVDEVFRIATQRLTETIGARRLSA